jgi:hypothetical protein
MDDFQSNFQCYVSLVTKIRTYDFRFESKENAVNFIVSISDSTFKVKPKFPHLVNKGFLKMLMMKLKLRYICK